jgi:hypothetical protein
MDPAGLSRRRKAAVGALALVATLAIGAALRLAWPRDIEFKTDEAWLFERTQRIGRGGAFPWDSDASSAGPRNPAMGLWILTALGRLVGAEDPPGLARGVQWLNVAALILLAGFVWRCVPAGEREPWLWATALVAVNPLAVRYQRKIWAPSTLPVFTMAFLTGWWHRDRHWGAFVWGLIGACLGQIHLGGFFFAAGFVAWAWLFDRRRIAWRGWLAGSVLGAAPLVPWLWAVLAQPLHGGHSYPWLCHVVELKFWLQWIVQPLGLSTRPALGNDFVDFLRYPLLGDQPTFLMALLHVVLFAAAGVVLVRATAALWPRLGDWRKLVTDADSPTAFTQGAALWGYGVLLTASLLAVQRHYLVILFPLPFVWLARQALVMPPGRPHSPRLGRMLLATLWAAQLVVTTTFLGYVHVNQRLINGDYDTPYGVQTPEKWPEAAIEAVKSE